MAIQFKRIGSRVVKDHQDLANRGVRTHSEIDRYLDEFDQARGSSSSVGNRISAIEDYNLQQDGNLQRISNQVDANKQRLDQHSNTITQLEGKVQKAEESLTHGQAVLTGLSIKKVAYVGTSSTIQVDIYGGSASINGTIIEKADSTISISSPSVRNEYYLFLNQQGSFIYRSTIDEQKDDMLIGMVSVAQSLQQVSFKDKRYALTKGSAGNLEDTVKEVVEARTDKNGVTYQTLRVRMNHMQTKMEELAGQGKNISYSYSPRLTRAANQTLFTVPEYTPGTSSLLIFIDGALVIGDFKEIDTKTIEMKYPIKPHSDVVFISLSKLAGGASSGLKQVRAMSVKGTSTAPHTIAIPLLQAGNHLVSSPHVLKRVSAAAWGPALYNDEYRYELDDKGMNIHFVKDGDYVINYFE
ncbi:hypothetical protein NQ117_09495 [Paenibacillus sp. SC116]|uniref:hypothetical protein n=1 Tax=Paenibacillus sp. SC116 TaxID=2968986 RepID=UPI00215B2B4C|nr:hypothetical protein [Paenibacillus sp. SC116]MCR8843921.1 hypothetical protein [Paenibacillus sp. SC116]